MTGRVEHLFKAVQEYDKELSYLINMHMTETSELTVATLFERIANIRNSIAANHGLSELSLDRVWELWSRFKAPSTPVEPVTEGKSTFSYSVTPSGDTLRVFHVKDGVPTGIGSVPFSYEAQHLLRAMAEIYEKDNL